MIVPFLSALEIASCTVRFKNILQVIKRHKTNNKMPQRLGVKVKSRNSFAAAVNAFWNFLYENFFLFIFILLLLAQYFYPTTYKAYYYYYY